MPSTLFNNFLVQKVSFSHSRSLYSPQLAYNARLPVNSPGVHVCALDALVTVISVHTR